MQGLLTTLRKQLGDEAYAKVERLVSAMQQQQVVLTREQFLSQIQAISTGAA